MPHEWDTRQVHTGFSGETWRTEISWKT